MSECSLSGRDQGHVSNFYIVDLENFATASRRYTGVIHHSTVVGLFMTPIGNESDSHAFFSFYSYHFPPRSPPYHYEFVVFRTIITIAGNMFLFSLFHHAFNFFSFFRGGGDRVKC